MSTKTLFTPEELQAAREQVARFFEDNAQKIKVQDSYAAHVTARKKQKNLQRSLQWAQEIREGKHDGNFTVAQRMQVCLTGDCTPFLA